MIKDFKPALFFLLRFLGTYLVGNLLYGLYVESYEERPDAVTHMVGEHAATFLEILGEEVSTYPNPHARTVFLATPEKVVLSVFEGCNGLNVMIVFLAFMVAFGGPFKALAWFIPVGLLIIHMVNILRVSMLFLVSTHFPGYFYFFHKYLFTAILYAVVFGLWVVWVTWFSKRKTGAHES